MPVTPKTLAETLVPGQETPSLKTRKPRFRGFLQ